MKGMSYVAHQMNELAVIAKHLLAMDAELQKLRGETPWSWGSGFFVNLNITATTDADEALGVFEVSETDGYDFYPHSEESNA